MIARLPALLTVRLLAALLLAAIGLQAGQSFEATARPVSGSAFSAATFEVALAPQRRSGEIQAEAAPLPPVVLPPAVIPLPSSLADLAAPIAPRPASTGPPTRPVLDPQSPPRAPPLA